MNNQFGQPQEKTSAAQSNLARALSGKYQFNLKSVFLRSNDLVRQYLWVLLPACFLVIAAVMLVAVMMVQSMNITDVTQISPATQGMMDVVLILLMAPLVTGLMMMGVHCARRERLRALDLFRYLPLILPLALAQLLISILTQFGLALLVLPGLYVFMASVFTLPLIADKRLPVSQALLLSCRVVNKYLGYFVVVFLSFAALFLLSVVTLGLALIWIVPLYYTTLGTLYEDLFGNGEPPSSQPAAAEDESRFDA
ncbi:hypothetical protein [Alteromonas aestuariivivens]|uniref:hypothetical protein n=1 Tax=Alteromonas aestuariivivens TaxID=1938339 RepID=UPI0011C02EF4|nr:hypothetical protein [Alteromonas aestuariivivens]